MAEVLPGQRTADTRGGLPGFHHPNHDVVCLFDVDRLAQRIAEGEQLLSSAGGQHTVVLLLTLFGVGQEMTEPHLQLHALGVRWRATDEPAVDRASGVAEASPQFADGQRLLDRRDGVDQSIEVVTRDAVRNQATHPAVGRFGRRLDRPHDDVVGPQLGDLLLCLAG